MAEERCSKIVWISRGMVFRGKEGYAFFGLAEDANKTSKRCKYVWWEDEEDDVDWGAHEEEDSFYLRDPRGEGSVVKAYVSDEDYDAFEEATEDFPWELTEEISFEIGSNRFNAR